MSWRAFHVNTYRSSTYLSKCHLVFYQKGRGLHSLLTSVPDGWVVRYPSLFFVCLLAVATYSPMWMLWGTCVLLTQRRSWEEWIEAQGENAFKWKDTTELPPRATRHFGLPPAGFESRLVTSPHPNRLLILSEFLFLSLWPMERAISLLCLFAFPADPGGWVSLVCRALRHGSFLGRIWGATGGRAACPSQYSPHLLAFFHLYCPNKNLESSLFKRAWIRARTLKSFFSLPSGLDPIILWLNLWSKKAFLLCVTFWEKDLASDASP